MPRLGARVTQGEWGEAATASQAATFLSHLCLGDESLTNTGSRRA